MPRPKQVERIGTGEVGFIVAAIKDLHDVRIGDTVTDAANPAPEALPGYKPIQQMVYCDFYPGGKTQYDELRDAMDRLQLNDSSFTFEPESNDALGFGFRCGFLGLLHMEIIQERLEREFHIEVDPDRADRHLRNHEDRRHRHAHRLPRANCPTRRTSRRSASRSS